MDQLYGEAGQDKFIFAINDAPKTSTGVDNIWDFTQADGDQIDFTVIDTNTSLSGDQGFAFISANGGTFTGAGTAEVRWYTNGTATYVEADLGNGGAAEMTIKLAGTYSLSESDFLL